MCSESKHGHQTASQVAKKSKCNLDAPAKGPHEPILHAEMVHSDAPSVVVQCWHHSRAKTEHSGHTRTQPSLETTAIFFPQVHTQGPRPVPRRPCHHPHTPFPDGERLLRQVTRGHRQGWGKSKSQAPKETVRRRQHPF